MGAFFLGHPCTCCYRLKVTSAGQTRISVKGSPDIIESRNTNITLNIIKSSFLLIIIHITGWIYFFLWSFSFYPQIFLNFKSQSVVGLNLDFVLLNVIGFGLYSCYNLGLFFSEDIQEQYFINHPQGVLPVQVILKVYKAVCHPLFVFLHYRIFMQ